MKLPLFAAAAIFALGLTAAPAGAQQGPDVSENATYGTTNLVSGFEPDPFVAALEAGGDYDASRLGVNNCVGFIARAPDYRINWTAGQTKLPCILCAV